MAEAEVGDDVYGEDPTINRLERRAAEILGKEAALFLPTGTMANTIAIKLQSEPGQEVICDDRSHLIDLELAMTSWYSNCQMRPIITADGIMRWSEIDAAIRPFSTSWPQTAVINIEHPHNMQGGTLYELEDLDIICDGAHERGVKVHLDGARIFNAAAATGDTAARIAAKADTVMFSLSKGLAAPVGSILAGTAAAIERGRVHRRRLGGGMRQAGILGAAALVALEDMRERLPEDHANARFLAEHLHDIPGIDIDLSKVRTNILVFDIVRTGLTFAEFSARLKSRGVLVSTPDGIRVRAVTHLDVTREDCERAVGIVREVLLP
jgi:threonine aldolase